MPPVVDPKRRALHWDGTITAGNVLTALAMLLSLTVWGLRIEGRTDRNDERIGTIERQREGELQQNAAARERLAVIEANQTAQMNLLSRVERQIERLLGNTTTGGR